MSASEQMTEIVALVEKAGAIAVAEQRAVNFGDRAYKADNSVVTQADIRVETFLTEGIQALYPRANIISEESGHNYDVARGLTFAVDPIDGTDVFSQGMATWCISVGILDAHLTPVAGVLYAPRLDLLLVADDAGNTTFNGSVFEPSSFAQPMSSHANLMVTSRIHRQLDLSSFPGKIRGFGSAALHLSLPLIYPAVIGAVEGPGVHIWDIAASHAINLAQGRDLRYLSGRSIEYAALTAGETAADFILAGQETAVDELRRVLKRLPQDARPAG